MIRNYPYDFYSDQKAMDEYESKWNRWGNLPPNMEQIDADRFHFLLMNFSYRVVEYRQVTGASLKIFVMEDDSAIVLRYDRDGYSYWIAAPCHHKNATARTVANCLNEFKCPDCSAVWQVDSSG